MCREIGNFGGNRAMPAETKVKDYPVVDCTLIGKRVREARKSSHMTQEELAERCSCTPTHICNLENGKIGISLELLFRISSIFDKSMDYFVMDSPGANPQVKIDANIAPKLTRCDRDMLNIVDHLLDILITYRKTIDEEIGRNINQ